MSQLSFRKLDGGVDISGDSALEQWYKSVRDLPIASLSVDDLCRAIRQELYLAHVLPVALHKLRDDSCSGALWDGELASVIANVPEQFWLSYPQILSEARMLMESQDYSFDQKTNDEVQLFLERHR